MNKHKCISQPETVDQSVEETLDNEDGKKPMVSILSSGTQEQSVEKVGNGSHTLAQGRTETGGLNSHSGAKCGAEVLARQLEGKICCTVRST